MPTAIAPTPTTVRYRRLRLLREEQRLSQVDLAAQSGTSQATISLAERGFATVRILRRLARVLGVRDARTLMDVIELGFVRATPAPPPADPVPLHTHRDELGRFAPLPRAADEEQP